jgi:hypothetical protein
MFFAAACVPSQSAIQSAPQSSLISPKNGLIVHSGNVTVVSNNDILVQTAEAPGKDYSEVYFEIPIEVEKPLFISFKVDYPTATMDETVELVFPEFSYGFVPFNSEHWSKSTKSSIRPAYWKYEPENNENEAAKLKENNLVYIFVPDSKPDEFRIYTNYIYQFQAGSFNLDKLKSIGIKIHAEKGERKTAAITNFVIVSGPLASEAYDMIQAEGKSIAEGYYAQWKKGIEDKSLEYSKQRAELQARVVPVDMAVTTRDDRKRERDLRAALATVDLMEQLLIGLFRSTGDYLWGGSPSAGGTPVKAGSRAVLLCADTYGVEREVGVPMLCLSTDTFQKCSDRLVADLISSGYENVAAYCDAKNPTRDVSQKGRAPLNGYIAIR